MEDIRWFPRITHQFKDPESADLVLVGSNGEVGVHSELMAAVSPYFTAMLSSEWREAQMKKVQLPHLDASHIQIIVDCLYSKNMMEIDANMEEIFPVVHSLEISFLVEYSVEKLLANIRTDNIVELYRAALHFNVDKLYHGCLKNLLNNLSEYVKDDVFCQEIDFELIHQLVGSQDLNVANEDQVLEIINDWSEVRPRQEERRKLLECVRYAHLSKSVFRRVSRCECSLKPDRSPMREGDSSPSDTSECGEDCENCVFQTIESLQHLIKSDFQEDNEAMRARNYQNKHIHLLWCKYSHVETFRGHEILLRCSLDPHQNRLITLHQSDDAPSQELVRSLMNNNLSIIGGYVYYDCDSEILKREETKLRRSDLVPLGNGKVATDILLKNLPARCFLITTPIFDGEYFYVAHITGESTRLDERSFLMLLRGYLDKDDRFYNRFLNGFTSITLCRFKIDHVPDSDLVNETTRTLSDKAQFLDAINVEDELSGYNLFRAYTHPKRNRLIVQGERKLLMLGLESCVIGMGSSAGKLWRMEKHKLASNECELDNNGFQDMIIIGDLCYVYVTIDTAMIDRVRPQSDKKRYYGERNRREIRIIDLEKGEFVDEVIRLEHLFPAENIKSFKVDLFENCGRLFILGSTFGPSRYSHAAQAFLWRVDQLPDGSHRVEKVLDEFNVGNMPLEEIASGEDAHEWRAIYVPVDLHPCQYATALHVRTSQEKNTVRREILRKYTLNL